MRKGLGIFIVQIAVALYLIAVGILAFSSKGQLVVLIRNIGINNNVIFIIAGVIALIAGIGELLEVFGIEIPVLNTLVFVVAIIWAIFIIIQIIGWIRTGFGDFWTPLSQLAVNCIILGSLINSSRRFD